jgi:AhpD family alkylhydroperoxidase
MKNYPEHYNQILALMQELGHDLPSTMSAFGRLHRAGVSPGELTPQTKELIALAIAVVLRCDGCVAFHVHDTLKSGASHGAIMEALSVAILMGGGPAVMYACEALAALKQFEAEKKTKITA